MTDFEVPDPKPGLIEAALAGCTCPVIDNHHGAGWRGNPKQWAVRTDCPLHGAAALAGGLPQELRLLGKED